MLVLSESGILLEKAASFAKHLATNKEAIVAELASYQSYSAAEDEFQRSIECLLSLGENLQYLGRRTKSICVFFPLNLPIYTFTLFAFIPSLIADEVYLRPPQVMMPLIRRLLPLLDTKSACPNIHVCFGGRSEFVQRYAAHADVTIFTGLEKNARQVLSQLKKDSLFLFNGFGCNPIVANPDADLEFAVKKTVEAKLFNSGQDCAGPDTILVHRSIADQFINMLKTQLNSTKVGPYTDPEVKVGKIMEMSQLEHLSTLLLKYQDYIVYGGCVDYRGGIVHPTVIVSSLDDHSNFKEFFSPIFFVSIFENDEQLSRYFEDPQYSANEMYVTTFGSSHYVENLSRSIILRNKTILDIERGTEEYGGMSVGASFVSSHGKTEARPILVPREISRHLEEMEKQIDSRGSRNKKRICEDVRAALAHFFGSNLVFGFVFGSVAKGRATRNSDIDTMVVLECEDKEQIGHYLEWLDRYQLEMGMTPDHIYPAEVVTRNNLDQALRNVDSITMDLEETSPQEFDTIIWVDVLSGIKRGIQGNQDLLLEYGRRVGRYPKIWKKQILRELERRASPASQRDQAVRQFALQQLQCFRRMKPDEVVKRFIGIEHLSAEQRETNTELIRQDLIGSCGRGTHVDDLMRIIDVAE
jgi:acyl-CoA reductase-like NAD-dependent aldehyde dehydrogenase/predicted nucleotidyltransferase